MRPTEHRESNFQVKMHRIELRMKNQTNQAKIQNLSYLQFKKQRSLAISLNCIQ